MNELVYFQLVFVLNFIQHFQKHGIQPPLGEGNLFWGDGYIERDRWFMELDSHFCLFY